MLKYFGLSLILVVATTLAASFAKNFDKPKIFGIVGGNPSGVIPYQVSLEIRQFDNSFRHHCGGSIIRADCILTAAHCIQNRPAKSWRISAGSSTRDDVDAVKANVRDIIVHPNFNKALYTNDVALIFLETYLPINQGKIALIPLATQAPKYGTSATVTGWGATSSGGHGSDKLLKAEMPIMNIERCKKDYAAIFGTGRITNDMICAGYEGVGGKDACQGDSGGPLVCNGELVGVVSWGYGCALPYAPGVYASVAHFRRWISLTL